MKNLIQAQKVCLWFSFLLFLSCKKDASISHLSQPLRPAAEINVETALNIAKVFKVPVSINGAPPNFVSNSAVQNVRQKTLNVGPRFLHNETEVVNIWLGSGYPTYGGGS